MDNKAANQREEARKMYWQGYRVPEISNALDVPAKTIHSWKRRDKWDETNSVIRLESGIDERLARLVAKENKTDQDFREMDHLGRLLERTARIQKYGETGKEKDLNPNVEKRAEGRKKKQKDKKKNFLTEEQVEDLVDAFQDGLFKYQKTWYHNMDQRIRNIMKSRQIGATWYFAREALVDAITTGDNQIFLSASKAQAHVFREYIVAFVEEVTGVLLTGDPIKLWNGATLYFLGTNSKTAQSYHGHVYMDEYGWISKFLEFRKVASAMATHKKWRITYFSTPSTINHDSHAFWSGAVFNKYRAKDDQTEFDVSHDNVKNGMIFPDGQWRHMVTIHDAEDQGCNLFDIDQLRLEYNDQDFANLFLCEWVDDTQSYFTFAELQKNHVDSWEAWAGQFSISAARPYGDLPVWIGYDPSENQDNASITVVAPPPRGSNSKVYKILEKINCKGSDFPAQAEVIRQLTFKYNVEHIGVDATTVGSGVFDIVKTFFPTAVGRKYSTETKWAMVLKAKQLISKGLLNFDAGWTDVTQAFMSIRKTMTSSGRHQTFVSSRSRETGHADVAWSIMHALDKLEFTDFPNDNDPGGNQTRKAFVEFC